MRIQKDGITIASLEDWRQHAPPKSAHQWAPGHSAMECAIAWLGQRELPAAPAEIGALLATHPDTAAALILTISPEHRVSFDRLPGEPRNADLVALATSPEGPIAISIEAKADESFGRTVERVAADVIDNRAHGDGSNMLTRIENLAAALLPKRTRSMPRLGILRYQLLTAAAGALAYAAEQNAVKAVLIVHEFVTSVTSNRNHAANQRDLERFVTRLSGGMQRSLPVGSLIGPFHVPGVPLFERPAALYIGKAVRRVREPTA